MGFVGGRWDRRRAGPASYAPPPPALQAAFTARMQAELSSSTVWPACASWYNLGGRRNVALWPHSVSQFWWETRPGRVDWGALEFRGGGGGSR